MTEKYLVAADGTDRQGLQAAMETGLILAEKHNCNLTLFVPSLKDVLGTSLVDVLSKEIVSALAKGKAVPFKKHSLIMKSHKTLEPIFETGVIIGLWIRPKIMSKIEAALSCKAIVILPWQQAELEKWRNKVAPNIVQSGEV